MVCRIGNLKDTASLPNMPQAVRSLINTQVNLLCEHYGDNRDTNNDDGGIILYCTSGTTADELKEHFDYSKHIPEYVEVIDGVCHALYLTNNEYSVSIIMDVTDIPDELKEELK